MTVHWTSAPPPVQLPAKLNALSTLFLDFGSIKPFGISCWQLGRLTQKPHCLWLFVLFDCSAIYCNTQARVEACSTQKLSDFHMWFVFAKHLVKKWQTKWNLIKQQKKQNYSAFSGYTKRYVTFCFWHLLGTEQKESQTFHLHVFKQPYTFLYLLWCISSNTKCTSTKMKVSSRFFYCCLANSLGQDSQNLLKHKILLNCFFCLFSNLRIKLRKI